MSSTVSYANVAAKGGETTPTVAATESSGAAATSAAPSESQDAVKVETTEAEGKKVGADVAGSTKASSTDSASATAAAEDSSSAAAGAAASSGEDATSAATTKDSKPKEPKKSLAPAPVPAKSAWGASAATASAAAVDESKWPTPDKIAQGSSSQHPQKFIKPITNKWVPINAKVVLPSPKGSNKVQNRSRKNKKAQPKKNTINKKKNDEEDTHTSSSALPQQQLDEQLGAAPGSSQTQGAASATTGASAQSAQAAGSSSTVASAVPSGTAPSGPSTTSISSEHQQQLNVHSANGHHKNNFRRFNNPAAGANGAQGFKPRYSQQQPQQHQQQQQQHQVAQQNGQFYHPQPFNPGFQNYNQSRQFRPQGQQNGHGQFRPQQQQQGGRTFRPHPNGQIPHQNGGYSNGAVPFIPQQVQIPPPISPKQDPQQALIQQINYYFSLENLIRDIYLRKNMLEDGGWVPLSLILEFKRVKIIINGIQNSSEEDVDNEAIILDSVTKCDNLDVRYLNDKDAKDAKIEDVELRVKDNYEQWLLPATTTA